MDHEGKRSSEKSEDEDCPCYNCLPYTIASFRQQKAQAFKENFHADVCFKIGPGEVLFHAHKIFLAIASPVFENLFYESSLHEEDAVVIADIQPEGFHGLLRYIYSDDTHFKSFNEALAIQVVAEKYSVLNLKDICDRYIRDCPVTPENFCDVLRYAILMKKKSKKKKCLNYFRQNGPKILLSDNFRKASKEFVQQFLLFDEVHLNEILPLAAITSWAEANASAEETEKEIVKYFLPYIRFKDLAPYFFSCFIRKWKGVMSESDAAAILKCINQPDSCSLPDWCWESR